MKPPFPLLDNSVYEHNDRNRRYADRGERLFIYATIQGKATRNAKLWVAQPVPSCIGAVAQLCISPKSASLQPCLYHFAASNW
jgi:hypothetical protein